MTSPELIVLPTKEDLGTAIARRLGERIVAGQRARGAAHLVLTGGSMGGASLSGLRDQHGAELDWHTVHFWWGDERFVPAGNEERNETQARAALLDHIDVPAENVHVMAPSDGAYGGDVDAAARGYAEDLARHAEPGAAVPAFDVLLLGVGPDAHIASLFPHHPAQRVIDTSVIAVRESPKPPPVRLSLTYPAIDAAREVWFMVAGQDKAQAVAAATARDADRWDHPASGAHGSEATVWWLDEAAAGR